MAATSYVRPNFKISIALNIENSTGLDEIVVNEVNASKPAAIFANWPAMLACYIIVTVALVALLYLIFKYCVTRNTSQQQLIKARHITAAGGETNRNRFRHFFVCIPSSSSAESLSVSPPKDLTETNGEIGSGKNHRCLILPWGKASSASSSPPSSPSSNSPTPLLPTPAPPSPPPPPSSPLNRKKISESFATKSAGEDCKTAKSVIIDIESKAAAPEKPIWLSPLQIPESTLAIFRSEKRFASTKAKFEDSEKKENLKKDNQEEMQNEKSKEESKKEIKEEEQKKKEMASGKAPLVTFEEEAEIVEEENNEEKEKGHNDLTSTKAIFEKMMLLLDGGKKKNLKKENQEEMPNEKEKGHKEGKEKEEEENKKGHKDGKEKEEDNCEMNRIDATSQNDLEAPENVCPTFPRSSNCTSLDIENSFLYPLQPILEQTEPERNGTIGGDDEANASDAKVTESVVVEVEAAKVVAE